MHSHCPVAHSLQQLGCRHLTEEGPLFRCYWHMPSANWKAPSSRYLECLSLLVEESRTLKKAGDVCVQNVGG